jgi:hypothetical protein
VKGRLESMCLIGNWRVSKWWDPHRSRATNFTTPLTPCNEMFLFVVGYI